MPSADALNAIRSWIAVNQATCPTLGDHLTAGIPDDFVKQRQADPRVSAAALAPSRCYNLSQHERNAQYSARQRHNGAPLRHYHA
jgi:hypothetical protein